jgi:co-chaperonin GroES (HSP10)
MGTGEKLAKLNLQVGDKVIFGKWGGDDFKDGEKEYKILSHDQILAVIE